MFVALTVYSTSAQVGGGQQSVDLRLLIDLARFVRGRRYKRCSRYSSWAWRGNYHGVGQIRIAPHSLPNNEFFAWSKFVQDFLHKRRPADNTSAGLLPMTNLSVPKEGVERTLPQAPPVIRQA